MRDAVLWLLTALTGFGESVKAALCMPPFSLKAEIDDIEAFTNFRWLPKGQAPYPHKKVGAR